ncbi:SDR family oxidoreductase, partial [Paenibacillus sp. IB182496]
SGFGLLIAIELAGRGRRVLAGLRRLERAAALLGEADAAGVRDRIDIVRLDVDEPEEIAACIAYAQHTYGRLDTLVNNAGFAVGGFVEEVPMEAWRAQLETNFFGAVALTRAVLPLMRERRAGTIIQIGSISGRIAFPGYGPYAASKFALEGFTESLRHEMAPYGVRVLLVEPGAYRTAIWDKGLDGIHRKPDSPYAAALSGMLAYSAQAAASAPDPIEVARLVAALASGKGGGRLRHPIGRGARALLIARALVPWRLLEAAVRRALAAKRR